MSLARLQNLAMQSLKVLDNKYVAGFVRVFLILYAGLVAPKLPSGMAALFKNAAFKVFVLFLVVYVGMKDPTVALLVAVGFTISMVTLNKLETVDSLGSLIDAAVDAPQKVANDFVDASQDLARDVGGMVQKVSGPLSPVVAGAQDIVHGAVDMGQDVANTLVDTVQDAVGMFTRKPQPAEEDEVADKPAVGGYVDGANGAPLF
jgi:hypothetical protein